ncbi:hypothetical protein NDU88_002776 [Pleurodeles waltl]|uniref:Uncharacterized protein n=1 Tax=Pleurodeles waltl TaxID=8319 RepID=A0AAV7UBV5_PLEWA|nr:hypothetical protein NDU88_002776 [Pleurodeles waltl]
MAAPTAENRDIVIVVSDEEEEARLEERSVISGLEVINMPVVTLDGRMLQFIPRLCGWPEQSSLDSEAFLGAEMIEACLMPVKAKLQGLEVAVSLSYPGRASTALENRGSLGLECYGNIQEKGIPAEGNSEIQESVTQYRPHHPSIGILAK